ncbi:MAG: hypothetical protein HXL35_05205 [Prevotellaceae bacterium]|nr:hypothetical protein [Prevotellaceae bacterium]
MPKVERPVGGVLELSSVTSLYLFNAFSIPPYCYVFYSHILTPFQHGGRCSAAVSNAYGDRRTMCMTAVSSVADGRRMMSNTSIKLHRTIITILSIRCNYPAIKPLCRI